MLTTVINAGGSPGGSNSQVQFNNAGAFAGAAGLLYLPSGFTFQVISQSASNPVFEVRGISAQTGNLFRCTNNAGATVFAIDVSGNILAANSQSITFSALKWVDITVSPTGKMRVIEENAIGTNDVNFQANPAATGWAIFEAWNGVGASLGTGNAGNNAGPVRIRPNRTTVLEVNRFGNVVHTVQAAGTVGLEVRGAASQTADLQRWETNAGAVLSAVDASGRLRLPTFSGVPTGTPADGTIAGIDITNHRLYFRSGGTWKYAQGV
jgi:hypothetical protein